MRAWIANNRQFLLRGLGTLLALGLIIVLVKEEGWEELLTTFRSLSLSRILLALLFILISRLFVAARWHTLLRTGGVDTPFWRTVALTFTGLFSNNFLPTTVGGDVVRLAGIIQMGYDRAVSLASIAADRLIGMAGMFFALPFGLPQALTALGGGGVAQSIAIPPILRRGFDFARRTLQTFSIWLGRPLALLTALACTWAHMLCTFAALYIMIEGLGAHVDFWLLGGLWGVTYFVTLIPISINGYGVQELSFTYLLTNAAGLGTSLSLTVAILIRVLYMIASLPGAATMPGLLAAMGKGTPEEPGQT